MQIVYIVITKESICVPVHSAECKLYRGLVVCSEAEPALRTRRPLSSRRRHVFECIPYAGAYGPLSQYILVKWSRLHLPGACLMKLFLASRRGTLMTQNWFRTFAWITPLNLAAISHVRISYGDLPYSSTEGHLLNERSFHYMRFDLFGSGVKVELGSLPNFV